MGWRRALHCKPQRSPRGLHKRLGTLPPAPTLAEHRTRPHGTLGI